MFLFTSPSLNTNTTQSKACFKQGKAQASMHWPSMAEYRQKTAGSILKPV
jgi:hypothetical protein